WMIETGMIWNEIDHEPHAACVQLDPDVREVLPGTDAPVRLVARDGERRSRDIARRPTGQRTAERAGERQVVPRELTPERAALPDPHQIDNVHAAPLEIVPFAVPHAGERELSTHAPRQIVEPRPGVDLVQMWMGAGAQCE